MKRALCIWFSQWPLQRIATRGELDAQASVVLYQLNSAGGARVTAYCRHLASAAAAGWLHDTSSGIHPGMPLAEATALAMNITGCKSGLQLHLEISDPWSDRRALEALADECLCFAPTVGVEDAPEPDSLLLDVTGIDRLCGGEEILARQIVTDLRARGFVVRVAIADTPGAAWAMAHFAPLQRTPLNSAETCDADHEEDAILAALAEPLFVPSGKSRSSLGLLPPASLRLPPETCALLAELGIWQVDQLLGLRRDTLLARFGPLVLLKLDQSLGIAAEAIVARAVPPEWSFEWLLEHPTGRREMIEWVSEQLIARLCAALVRERRGLLRLSCRFVPERGSALEFVVGFYHPSASERYVSELVRLKLESVRFHEPLMVVRFEAIALGMLEFQQRNFLAGDEVSHKAPSSLVTLIDRLSNRLGAQNVVRPWLLAGAQPEFTCQYRPVASLKKQQTKQMTATRKKASGSDTLHRELRSSRPGDRPLWLEPEPLALAVTSVVPDGPPLMFRLYGYEHRIARTWGPERIETGWWRSRCVRRDYYQIETRTGLRYWLFRELNTGRWYLQGMFV
jgi:protein ImuB